MSTTTGIAHVDAYLCALERLSPADWLVIGRVEGALSGTAPALATAELLAGAIVVDRRLEVVRWQAVDAVDTCAALAAPARAPKPGPLLPLARHAARRAAVAMLVRDFLPDRDFRRLCASVFSVLGPCPPAPPRHPAPRG